MSRRKFECYPQIPLRPTFRLSFPSDFFTHHGKTFFDFLAADQVGNRYLDKDKTYEICEDAAIELRKGKALAEVLSMVAPCWH